MPIQIEHKVIPFEVKSVSEEGYGSFEGLGAAFKNLDAVGDIIAPGAFRDGLDDFLRDGFIGGLGHDWDSPIGHPLAVSETPEGLRIKAVFDASPEAQSVRAKMTAHPLTGRATVRNLSIGYRVQDADMLSPDECKSYWQGLQYTPSPTDLARARRGARLLKKVRTIEVSPVLMPANDLAQTTGVKSLAPGGFADHSRKVASAARELSAEFGDYVAKVGRHAGVRLKEGRVLSENNRRAIRDVLEQHRALTGQHSALCDQLQGVLDRTEPPGKSAGGVPPEPPAAATAIDEAAIFTAHYTLLAELG